VGQSGSRLPELKRRVQSDGADEQIGPAVPIHPDYRRIAIPLLYQAGTSVMGFFLSAHVLAISLLLRDPKLMERIRAIMMGKSGTWADRFGHQVLAELQAAMQGQEFLIGATLMVVIQIYLACWLVASWGAYRLALGLSRWRSALAYALFLLFA
jgi:hypothetical protein